MMLRRSSQIATEQVWVGANFDVGVGSVNDWQSDLGVSRLECIIWDTSLGMGSFSSLLDTLRLHSFLRDHATGIMTQIYEYDNFVPGPASGATTGSIHSLERRTSYA